MKKGILKLSNKAPCWSSEYLKVKENEDGIEVLGAAKRYVFNSEIFFALWWSFTFFFKCNLFLFHPNLDLLGSRKKNNSFSALFQISL